MGLDGTFSLLTGTYAVVAANYGTAPILTILEQHGVHWTFKFRGYSRIFIRRAWLWFDSSVEFSGGWC